MSLVIAFSGRKEAVIGGDRRSITFLGDSRELEDELYSGRIRTDEELANRAEKLQATIQVSDGREKVWRDGEDGEDGGVLVGEVTEISMASERRRRVYAVPGAYLMAEIDGTEARITGKGKSACVVLGNRLTKELANSGIKAAGGRINEAVIKSVFEDAARMTASVSRESTVLRVDAPPADPEAAVLEALRRDCEKSGWRLCGQR